MRAVLAVAADILREAASRKWFLGLFIAISLVLAALSVGLRIEVVDGALAATRLFGNLLSADIRSADVALRPAFQAASYVIYYGGLAFGILACADFGPSLLAPGRIEHLLSLPVRRFELLVGTFLGVFTLAALGAAYGSGGVVVLLGAKTGVWTLRPLAAGLLASASFAALYAPMLTAALFVRSAAFCAAAGSLFFAGGVIASYRAALAPMFEAGLGRSSFQALTLFLPRISALADAAGALAGSDRLDLARLAQLLAGQAAFALAALALGVWRFEQKDF